MTQPDGLASFARDLPLTRGAIAFAEPIHRGRLRASDGAPFILHPLEVAALLQIGGATDPIVAAGVLHDVVEQDETRLAEIEDRFGSDVSTLVRALTEDASIESYAPRKAALRRQVHAAGDDAAAVFAADKLAKVRELRVIIGQAHRLGELDSAESTAKLGHYRACLDMLDGVIPASPLVAQLRFEIAALRELPPGAGPAGLAKLAAA